MMGGYRSRIYRSRWGLWSFNMKWPFRAIGAHPSRSGATLSWAGKYIHGLVSSNSGAILGAQLTKP